MNLEIATACKALGSALDELDKLSIDLFHKATEADFVELCETADFVAKMAKASRRQLYIAVCGIR